MSEENGPYFMLLLQREAIAIVLSTAEVWLDIMNWMPVKRCARSYLAVTPGRDLEPSGGPPE